MTLDPDTYRKQLLLHVVYLAGLQDMDWREPSRHPPPPPKKISKYNQGNLIWSNGTMGNNVIQKLNASIISMLPVYCRILSFTGLLIGMLRRICPLGTKFLKKEKARISKAIYYSWYLHHK